VNVTKDPSLSLRMTNRQAARILRFGVAVSASCRKILRCYPLSTVTIPRPLTILCVSSYFKGNRFIETCKKEGCRTLLLTVEAKLTEPWAREYLDDVFALPSFEDWQQVMNAVSYLAWNHQIDRMAPLDDYDVELVARLREHLRIPGMGETTARYFRDKLAMRARAEDRGITIPRFVHTLNKQRIQEFVDTVPAPWMFKPRAEASSVGIKKMNHSDEVWSMIDSLGDLKSNYLLEEMIAGDLYHVDSIISEGEVVFAEPHKYRQPLFEIVQEGGIFATATVPRRKASTRKLLQANKDVVKHLGLVRGVMHTEFIKPKDGDDFYFLETAARVAGAHIPEMIEQATGVNLWEEWAKLEIAQGEWKYEPPKARRDYGGLIVSLARQEVPDTSHYAAPEIVWRVDKKNHVGLAFRSESHERIDALIEEYVPRVHQDFHASLPAPAKATS